MKTKYFLVLLLFVFACKPKATNTEKDAVDENGPVLYFFNSSLDLGKVKKGDIVKAKFRLQNKGKKDLLIHYVSASCGCTATHWETKPIRPNVVSDIEITFNSTGKHGKQVKEVYVSTNASKEEKILKFTCEVLEPNSDK
jgi:hypothetical protein